MKLLIYLLTILLAGKAVGEICQSLGYLPMPIAVFLAPWVAVTLVLACAYALVWFHLGHKPLLQDILPNRRNTDPHPGVWISGYDTGVSKSKTIHTLVRQNTGGTIKHLRQWEIRSDDTTPRSTP